MTAEPEPDPNESSPLIPEPIHPDGVAYALIVNRNQLYGEPTTLAAVIAAVLERCSNSTARDARMALRRLELEGALFADETNPEQPLYWSLPMEQPLEDLA